MSRRFPSRCGVRPAGRPRSQPPAKSMENDSAVLSVRNPRNFLPKLQEAVLAGELPLKTLDPLDLNLDAVFQYLTTDHA